MWYLHTFLNSKLGLLSKESCLTGTEHDATQLSAKLLATVRQCSGSNTVCHALLKDTSMMLVGMLRQLLKHVNDVASMDGTARWVTA